MSKKKKKKEIKSPSQARRKREEGKSASQVILSCCKGEDASGEAKRKRKDKMQVSPAMRAAWMANPGS